MVSRRRFKHVSRRGFKHVTRRVVLNTYPGEELKHASPGSGVYFQFPTFSVRSHLERSMRDVVTCVTYKAATNGLAVQRSVSGQVVVKVQQPSSCVELYRAAGLIGKGSMVRVFRCEGFTG